MAKESSAGRTGSALLEAAIVARQFYLDGMQKNDIAAQLGISRFKVARLIDEARASGIVRITVDMPADIDPELSRRLAEHYGIGRAIVVRTLDEAPEATGAVIGSAAARYVESILGADDVLGISWGTTLTHLVDALGDLPAADVVQLVGGVRSTRIDVGGVELLRRLAHKTGGGAHPLHAPLLVGSAPMAEQLRRDPSLADTIGRFGDISVALLGIGSWQPAESSLFTEFTRAEQEDLLARGAVADLCAVVLDAAGRVIDAPSVERAIGVTAAELRNIPQVVAVAGGENKVTAIASALSSGIVDTLVTDSHTATLLVARKEDAA